MTFRSALSSVGLDSPAGLEPAMPGAVVRSLHGSIARVAVIAAAVWQGVMLTVALVSPGRHTVTIVVVQALVGVLAVIALRNPRARIWLVLAMSSAGAASFIASADIDSSLTFAACWQINFSACFAGLLLLRRSTFWLIIAGGVGIAITVLVALPEWGAQLPGSIVVTQVSIIAAVRIGLGRLLRHARSVDDDVQRADEAELRSHTVRLESARIAEDSRALHDTAINTFAAIAAGRAAVRDNAAVRGQCARDIQMLERIRTGSAAGEVVLADMFERYDVRIHRSGVDDAALAEIDDHFTRDVVGAVLGCVREAITNTVKHAGTDAVVVDVSRRRSDVRISVSDEGAGFSVEDLPDRGIRRSILRRAEDHGFSAQVDSAPGRGTTVTLVLPLSVDAQDEPVLDQSLLESASSLQRRSATYWGIGVTSVSIILTLIGGTNSDNALFPMIAIMCAAVAVTMLPQHRLTIRATPALLIVATLAVFVFSARATDFGTVGATHWQALAATGPFVLLLATTRSNVWRWAGALAWIALVAALAVGTLDRSSVGASIIIVAGLVGLGFSGVWVLFQGFIARMATIETAARTMVVSAGRRAARVAAAQAGYQRWVNGGLESAVDLLRRIRDGEVDPDSPAARSACDEEERYLRQLVQVGPELTFVGRTIIPLLRQARSVGATLQLRIGESDAPDELTARRIGTAIAANLTPSKAGRQLAVSLFPVGDHLQLTQMGRALSIPPELAADATRITLAATELLEITFPREDSSRTRDTGELG